MQIVYYVCGWPPENFPNGVVTSVARLAPAIRALGHGVTILPNRTGPGHHDRLPSLSAGRAKSPLRVLRRKLAPNRQLFEEPPREIARRMKTDPALKKADIFEIEESFGWSAAIARRIVQPVVTRLHGPYFLTGAAANDGVFTPVEEERIRREGEAIKSATMVTAPSRFVINAVQQHYQCTLSNAAVIANPAPEVQPKCLWSLDSADRNEIVFIGRFDRIKGADTLLQAFTEVAKKRPLLKLTFAGPCDRPLKHNGVLLSYENFLQTVAPPDIARRVRFLGPLPQEALQELRRRAFLTIISSRIEMFANVLVEAFIQGAPAIASRAGGIPEVAGREEAALLVEPANAPALAAAIETLLDNPARAAALGEAGRRRAEAFAAARIAAEHLAVYAETAARFKKVG